MAELVTLIGLDYGEDVRIGYGPPYKVPPRCSNPLCRREATDAHHIVSRSHLRGSGERNWVEVDGDTYPNMCGLCRDCHRQVTGALGGYLAAIYLREGQWWWCVVSERGELSDLSGRVRLHPVGPLDPHPPTLEGAEHASRHADPESAARCPTCGQRKRRGGAESPPRRRKTWTVSVPDDAQENGAQILDALVDDLALVLELDPGPSARYYVLVPALYAAQTDRARFKQSLRGEGG